MAIACKEFQKAKLVLSIFFSEREVLNSMG